MSTKKKPKVTCGVAIPVPKEVVPYGWKICGEEAITTLPSARKFKFEHSVQYAGNLCVAHTEEGEMLPEPKAKKEKVA